MNFEQNPEQMCHFAYARAITLGQDLTDEQILSQAESDGFEPSVVLFLARSGVGPRENPRTSRVQELINTAPSSWRTMFARYNLPTRPTVKQLIETVLEYTPSMRRYGDRGDNIYEPPDPVRAAALKGLELSHANNYTSASGIGLVRAMQLVVEPTIWSRSVQRMSRYFDRHEVDKNARNFGNDADPSRGYMAWLNWGGNPGQAWADRLVAQGLRANPAARDSKGRKIPARYLEGLTGKRRQKRIKEIEKRRDAYAKMMEDGVATQSELDFVFRPFETDKGGPKRPSKYTLAARNRGFTGSLAEKARKAGKFYGGKIPVSILKKVYAKGMAAWASGGHRPGASKFNWADARVNSFLVGGKTFFTADRKLAEQLPANVRKAIERERVWKG